MCVFRMQVQKLKCYTNGPRSQSGLSAPVQAPFARLEFLIQEPVKFLCLPILSANSQWCKFPPTHSESLLPKPVMSLMKDLWLSQGFWHGTQASWHLFLLTLFFFCLSVTGTQQSLFFLLFVTDVLNFCSMNQLYVLLSTWQGFLSISSKGRRVVNTSFCIIPQVNRGKRFIFMASITPQQGNLGKFYTVGKT
jgi:hypothetical protein